MSTASQLHREIHILEDKIQRWTKDLERNKKQLSSLKEKLLRLNMNSTITKEPYSEIDYDPDIPY